MAVTLREITDDNRDAVLALRAAPEQERFVGSVREALADAAAYPEANAWYRAVHAGASAGKPAGFYRRLGFVPTGDVDGAGETIVGLRLV